MFEICPLSSVTNVVPRSGTVWVVLNTSCCIALMFSVLLLQLNGDTERSMTDCM